MAKRTKSSQRWLQEHERDVYVKRAREEGYRSRAVFKLEEIQQTDRIFAAWYDDRRSRGCPRRLEPVCGEASAREVQDHCAGYPADGDRGRGICSRRLHSGDNHYAAHDLLGDAKVDLVLSDMAPNMSGIADVDHDRSMYMIEFALDFDKQHLAERGDFLTKVFQGRDFQPFMKQLRESFETVKVRKPPASRQRSSELYLLARNFHS